MLTIVKIVLPWALIAHFNCNRINENDRLTTEILSEFNNFSIKKHLLNWNEIRRELSIDTSENTNQKLTKLLRIINDGHSSIITPNGECLQAKCYSLNFDSSYFPLPGYIELDSFSDPSTKAAYSYIEKIQDKISFDDSLGTRRWIIDLRRNTGGNFWTMFQAVSMLLNDNNYNAFGDADGNKTVCKIMGGFAYQDSIKIFPNYLPRKLINEPHRILVLTSPVTASAAEALILAFKQNPKTTIAGTATFGATTTITVRTVDNYQLRIASGAMFDHKGTKLEGQIFPDITAKTQTQIDSLIKSFLSVNDKS